MDNKNKFNLVYTIIAVFGILLLHEIWVQQQTIQPVPYSELEELLEKGKVAELTIRERFITGQLNEADI